MIVFPEPAKTRETISSTKEREGGTRTYAGYPQKRTFCFPFPKHLPLREPCGRATVRGLASKIVDFPWIWRRQPVPDPHVPRCLTFCQFHASHHHHNHASKPCAPSIT